MLIPIVNIIGPVGVIDENPEMIEEKHGVALFLNSDEERAILKEDGIDKAQCHDIVWEVLDIQSWSNEFLSASAFMNRVMKKQEIDTQEEEENQ